MPRHLRSRFYRVALSGKTADGRTIDRQDLLAMAENYSIDTYTAVIWVEHDHSWYIGGTVPAIEAREENDGKIGLYAQISPNKFLLAMNEDGQKLFTSIEITHDFADLGTAYLTGLAVTDQPASLGTEQLYFTKGKQRAPFIKPEAEYFSNNFTLNFSETDEAEEKADSFFRSFSNWLFKDKNLSTDPQENPDMAIKPTQPTTRKRMNFTYDGDSLASYIAVRDQLQAVVDGMNIVIDGVEVDPTPPSQEVNDALETVETAAEIVAEDVLENEELSRQTLEARIFNKIMASIQQTPSNARPFSKTTGAVADQPRKRIL